MKFLTLEQLNNKFKNKKILDITDLIQVIEEEFEVEISVRKNDVNKINVEEIMKDLDIIAQIEGSKKDRFMGRTYTGDDGLNLLHQKIAEFNNETNL